MLEVRLQAAAEVESSPVLPQRRATPSLVSGNGASLAVIFVALPAASSMSVTLVFTPLASQTKTIFSFGITWTDFDVRLGADVGPLPFRRSRGAMRPLPREMKYCDIFAGSTIASNTSAGDRAMRSSTLT